MNHFLDEIRADQPFGLEAAHRALHILHEQILRRSRDPQSDGPQIVGQQALVRRLVISFLLGEHCLLEGLPGLVKTEVSKTLASMLGLVFRRIQFTPDMMPSDLISRERLKTSAQGVAVVWEPGPIFTNVLLADEINRAPSKVQSALLEATEERQVTDSNLRSSIRIRPRHDVDEELLLQSFPQGFFGRSLEKQGMNNLQHFMVLATMNPIEQEGVFPLSEAQLDRFAFKVIVEYPRGRHLKEISRHAFMHSLEKVEHDPEQHVKTLYFLSQLREKLLGETSLNAWLRNKNQLRLGCQYLIEFSHLGRPSRAGEEDASSVGVQATLKHLEAQARLTEWRKSGSAIVKNKVEQLLDWNRSASYPEVLSGASPRGLLKLIRAAHAEAFLNGSFLGEEIVPTWNDVRVVAGDILRHRIRVPGFSMNETSVDEFLRALIDWIDPASWDGLLDEPR